MWRPFQLLVETRLAIARGEPATASARLATLFDGYDWSAPSDEYHRAHEVAAGFYAERGDYPEAYRHAAAFAAIDGRINGAAAANSFNLMNAEFEASNRDLLIERLRSARLEAEVASARDEARLRAVVSLGVLLALAGGLLFVVLHLRSAQRASDLLARTNEELVAANHTKTRFLANTSHEIRTPLNAILGMTQVLLRDDRAEEAGLTSMQRERLSTIERSGQLLLAIVSDILDVAKMEAGHLDPVLAPADLAELGRSVVGAHQGSAERKGVGLRLEMAPGLPGFLTDGRLVAQALGNLVSNAVKFTDEGEVVVSVRAAPDGFEVAVRDTGIGIRADRLDTVFESFRQVEDGADRQHGGTGLGLAIVRNIAQVLGGTVHATSEPGEGSTFVFRVPAEAAEAVGEPPAGRPEPADAAERASSLGDLNVLLAEDNVVNVQVVRAMIGREVGNIDVAEDGFSAVERVRMTRYDVVLMDNQMPGMSGGQATAAIRAMPGRGDVPIIGVTGDVAPAVRADLMAAGMDAIIAKPISRAELIAALSAARSGALRTASAA